MQPKRGRFHWLEPEVATDDDDRVKASIIESSLKGSLYNLKGTPLESKGPPLEFYGVPLGFQENPLKT